jgi:hypothetical protein
LPNLDVRSNLEGRHVGDVRYTWKEEFTDYFIVTRDMYLGRILKLKKGDCIPIDVGKNIITNRLYSFRIGDLQPVMVEVEREERIEGKSVEL